MSIYRCNTCQGVYSDHNPDGSEYYHVCPLEVVTPAVLDALGKVMTPEQRAPLANRRDERPDTAVHHVDGVPMRLVPNPEERGRHSYVPAQPAILAEGQGRTLIE